MVKLQGVTILRLSDFRRFFNWNEFWAKKEIFAPLFRSEISRRVQSKHHNQENYYFVDNDKEFYLMQKFYEWTINPDKELQRVKLESAKLKIEAADGEIITYELGRLQEEIANVRKKGQLTKKTIVGYTLLYLMLGANEPDSNIVIDYGIAPDFGTGKNRFEIKEFESRWDDIVLEKTDKPVYPLRRCVLINNNPDRNILVVRGNQNVVLKPNECVVGIFCGDSCLQLLDNIVSDFDSEVTLKLSLKGNSVVPVCEVHRSTGVTHIKDVASIAIEGGGNIVYSTMNGDIIYNKDCFSLDLRVKTFKEQSYSGELLGFKKGISGSYIFYCKNKIDY